LGAAARIAVTPSGEDEGKLDVWSFSALPIAVIPSDDGEGEAPNSNIQAPKNLQHPNPQRLAGAVWSLKFGASLDVGA
jgi:hypothetical protein